MSRPRNVWHPSHLRATPPKLTTPHSKQYDRVRAAALRQCREWLRERRT